MNEKPTIRETLLRARDLAVQRQCFEHAAACREWADADLVLRSDVIAEIEAKIQGAADDCYEMVRQSGYSRELFAIRIRRHLFGDEVKGKEDAMAAPDSVPDRRVDNLQRLTKAERDEMRRESNVNSPSMNLRRLWKCLDELDARDAEECPTCKCVAWSTYQNGDKECEVCSLRKMVDDLQDNQTDHKDYSPQPTCRDCDGNEIKVGDKLHDVYTNQFVGVVQRIAGTYFAVEQDGHIRNGTHYRIQPAVCDDPPECPRCEGRGIYTSFMSHNAECSLCSGKGWIAPQDVPTEVPATEAEQLREENALLKQTSALLCDKCGWAMKFPDEECAHCERYRLREENAKLKAQFPEGMENCTFYFKSCPVGHGRLLATNWIDGGCLKCKNDKLESERDSYEKKFHGAMELAKTHLQRTCEAHKENEKLEAEIAARGHLMWHPDIIAALEERTAEIAKLKAEVAKVTREAQINLDNGNVYYSKYTEAFNELASLKLPPVVITEIPAGVD